MTATGNVEETRADVLAALQRARTYLAHDPENPALLARVAGLALRAGLPDEADEAVRRLAAGVDESALVLQLRAQVLMARQCYAEALPLLERACAISGESSVRSDLALALWRCGRPQDCVALVASAADGDPAALPAPMLASYLRSLHALGELEAAKDAFDAMMRAGVVNDELRGIGALVLFDLDLADDAAVLLSGIVRPEAMNLEACVVGGYLAVARQDTAAAVALFEPALVKSPGDARTMLGLGLACMADGDLAMAERWLRKAVERMPTHLGSWHTLGWCRFCAGDPEGATGIFQEALELDRNFGESHGALAVMHAVAGRRAEAAQSLERALRLDPDSGAARFAELLLRGDASPAEIQALARQLGTRQTGG